MSKIGKVLAVVGAALGVVLGFFLGGMVHRRPGKGRAGSVGDVHGGAADHAGDAAQRLEGELGGITDIGDGLADAIDAGTIHADAIADTNRDALTGIRRIKDILAKAKRRDDSGGDT